MRSVPAGSFDRLSALLSLFQAYRRTSRGKRRQPSMSAFDLDADTHLCRLYRELRAGSYQPGPHRLHVIKDPKIRLIAAAPIRDRVVHQALIGELAPHYEPSFIDQSYACCQGRGPHRAALRYLSLMRRHRCRLSLDVRRYFPSIRHDVLLALFFHRLRDERTRALLVQLVQAGGEVYRSALARQALGLDQDPLPAGCGLAIGSYLSQWSGAGDEAAGLERARDAIEAWLRRERGLELGRKRWDVVSTRQPACFVGYHVTCAGLWPGPKVKKRLRVRVRAAAARGGQALTRTLRSYRGIFLF